MDVTLRLLTPGDEPFLWTALYLALHVPPGAPPFPTGIVRAPEIARYVSGWMARSGDVGVIAERDGMPVGAAWVRLWNAGDEGFGFVDAATPELSMAVVPECRRQGIGAAMVERVCREVGDVSLSIAASNPAMRLYKRLGFSAVQDTGGSVTMVRRSPTRHGDYTANRHAWLGDLTLEQVRDRVQHADHTHADREQEASADAPPAVSE